MLQQHIACFIKQYSRIVYTLVLYLQSEVTFEDLVYRINEVRLKNRLHFDLIVDHFP